MPNNLLAASLVSILNSLGLSNSLFHLLNKPLPKLVLHQSTLAQILLTAEPCELPLRLRFACRGPPQLLHQQLLGRLQGSRCSSYAALWMAAA